jgi:hypothetical protein
MSAVHASGSAPPLAVPDFGYAVCQAPFEDAWRYALRAIRRESVLQLLGSTSLRTPHTAPEEYQRRGRWRGEVKATAVPAETTAERNRGNLFYPHVSSSNRRMYRMFKPVTSL